jgi:hypothetical protein
MILLQDMATFGLDNNWREKAVQPNTQAQRRPCFGFMGFGFFMRPIGGQRQKRVSLT